MPANPSPKISNAERDPDLYVWFLTLVIAGMYAVTLYNKPTTRQLGVLIPFTVLVLTHIILHWQMGRLKTQPSKIFWYIIIQGVLALLISAFTKNLDMIFALFMILLGEAIGMFKLTRRSLFASVFYLLLMVISLVQLSGWELSGLMILNSIPIVIFVVLFVTLYMRQNEAREQAQLLAVELEAANRQLSEYVARVEDLTIANERQRMARELHDTLSQGLAGLILQLEAADAHHSNNRIDEAQTVVSNAMGQARSTLADARRAIDDLRQPSLDDLDSALRLEISEFTEATGITCSFTSDPIPPLPDLVKDSLTRSLAEALTNIEKHAKAKKLEVNVGMKDNKLLVTIQDDGQGFDASFIPSGHYGILGIKERVRLVNGSFEIQSEKGNGTLMKIQVPL